MEILHLPRNNFELWSLPIGCALSRQRSSLLRCILWRGWNERLPHCSTTIFHFWSFAYLIGIDALRHCRRTRIYFVLDVSNDFAQDGILRCAKELDEKKGATKVSSPKSLSRPFFSLSSSPLVDFDRAGSFSFLLPFSTFFFGSFFRFFLC